MSGFQINPAAFNHSELLSALHNPELDHAVEGLNGLLNGQGPKVPPELLGTLSLLSAELERNRQERESAIEALGLDAMNAGALSKDEVVAMGVLQLFPDRTKIADIYDHSMLDVSGSIGTLVPDFEYPDWSYKTLGDLRKQVYSRVQTQIEAKQHSRSPSL